MDAVSYREAGDRLELRRTFGRTCREGNMELSKVASTADEAAATSSSGMVAKQTHDILACERFHEQWVDEFESFVYLQGGVDPAEHRHRLEPPIFPGACACRPVDRAEVKGTQAAEKAMPQEWDRLRSRKAWGEINPREWEDVATEARETEAEVHCWDGVRICSREARRLSRGRSPPQVQGESRFPG